MNFTRRLDAVEDKLNVTMTPHQAAYNKELQRRINEARKRCGIVRRDPDCYEDYAAQGGSLADRLRAARERKEAKQVINRTVQG